MSKDKKLFSYESPNIVIVPTISFLNGPPAKKIKLDNVSETTLTTNDNKTFKTNKSWASNYLQSIGHSQLATSSKPKIPIVCQPDKGTNFEDQKNFNIIYLQPENGVRKSPPEFRTAIMHKTNLSKTKLPLDIKATTENNVVQQNPKTPISSNYYFFGGNQTNSVCASEIEDKHSSVDKKRNEKLNLVTLKSQCGITKNPAVLPSQINSDNIGRNLIQKQYKMNEDSFIKAKLNNESENNYKLKKDLEEDKNSRNSKKIRNEVIRNNIKVKASHDRFTSGTKGAKKTLPKNGSCIGIKKTTIHEIDNRVKSLISNILPGQTNRKRAPIQLDLVKNESKAKCIKTNNNVQNFDRISDSQKHENSLVMPYVKRENSDKPIHQDLDKLQRKSSMKASYQSQTQKDKYNQSSKSRISECKISKNTSIVRTPIKHKQLKNVSKKVCDVKEHVRTEKVTKVKNASHDSNSGKISLKKTFLKSVVQLTDNFEFKVPPKKYFEPPFKVEDLRKKLNRGKKYRDNLIVSVPNDVTFDRDDKIKEDLLIQNKSNEQKVTTIKLIINLISGKAKENLISGKAKEKCVEEKPKSNEINECELASLDLSFLDDFNVDDIVDSLNYDINSCKSTKEDNEKLNTTKFKRNCEALKVNHMNNNEPFMNTELGSTCKNNTKLAQDGIDEEINGHEVKQEKTSHEIQIGIKTESITKIEVISNKPLNCIANKEKAFSENKKSCSSAVHVSTSSSPSNLIELGSIVVKTETETSVTENSAEGNNTFPEEGVTGILSGANYENGTLKDLTKPKQETIQELNKYATNQISADKLLKHFTTSFEASKNSYNSSNGLINVTKPDQNMQQANKNIINKHCSDNMPTGYPLFDLTEPEPNTSSKMQQLNVTVKTCADTLIKSSNSSIDTPKNGNMTHIDLTVESKQMIVEIENDTLKDLTKLEEGTGMNKRELNENVTDQSAADNLLKPFTTTIETSKNSYNTSSCLINITEPEQKPDQNMQKENKNIKKKSSNDNMPTGFPIIDLTEPEVNTSPKTLIDTLIKSTNSDIDTSKNGNITHIDLTAETVQMVAEIASNVDILKTNCLPSKESEIEQKTCLKTQSNFKEIVATECISQTQQNVCEDQCEGNKVISILAQNSNETVNQKPPKSAKQTNDSDKSHKNVHLSDYKYEPNAADASGMKRQDNSGFKKLSTRATTEITVKKENSVTMSLICQETLGVQFLKVKLKARMYKYFGTIYDIGTFIGKGKYSRIFHCTDQEKNDYAIKILHEKQVYALGIKKEKMLIDIQKDIPKENQHLVNLMNGFPLEGRWCFMMEYYPINLRHVLKDKKDFFHISDVQKLSRQLVSAVIMLRHKNLVHSDIKPEHILLNSSLDRLKLCGFDECRSVDQVIILPNIGTASYRAPEVILGYSDGFSIDVWSTALVMFEMATGRRLFPGVYNNDILYQQMSLLGNIPFEMVQLSIFKEYHFRGNHNQVIFMRRTGFKGKDYVLITHFKPTFGIANQIYKRHQKCKANDRQKIASFSDLLHEMLVLDPKHRLPIEFVYANPLLYESFDGNDLL